MKLRPLPSVAEIYKTLHDMVISFQFPPGSKINEVRVAESLGVSRTPVRQVLQELATQKLILQIPNKGFFSRDITKEEIFDLYEMRECIEVKSVQLAAQRATDQELKGLYDLWETGSMLPNTAPTELLHKRDRDFHVYIAQISGNKQIVDLLKNINDRIYFIRWIDMTDKAEKTQREHRKIAEYLLERKGDQAAAVMQKHISKRMEDISLSVREAYARIFTGQLPQKEEWYGSYHAVADF